MKHIVVSLKEIRLVWLKSIRWLMTPIYKRRRYSARKRMAKAGGEYIKARMEDRSATDFLEKVLPPLEKKEG